MRRREWFTPVVLWVLLTVVGEAAVWSGWFLPESYAREGRIGDDAFLFLTRLAIPVMSFVVAMVVVAIVRGRSKGRPTEDGPALIGTPRVFAAWLGVTGALAVLLIINPGLTGLAAMRHGGEHHLVVEITATQWFWSVTYPDSGVTVNDELVVPVDQRVRFDVTSTDVLHSFWIPAFGMKVDAVPGRTTVAHVTAEKLGTAQHEEGLRLQCAELCGLGHATMAIPVRVVTAEEFDRWLAGKAGEAGGGDAVSCGAPATSLALTADDVAFDANCLSVPAGAPFEIAVENAEEVPHNVSIHRDEGATDLIFEGETFTGPASRTYAVPALEAGRYFFRCDLHPIPAMSGVLVVEAGDDEGSHD